MKKERDLTSGNITSGLWAFAVPLMLGNVIQQFYNLADTWIVGRYIGNIGLAAVGSSYTLMTFFNIYNYWTLPWKQYIYFYGIWKKEY